MKKGSLLIFAAVLMISLCACSKESAKTPNTSAPTSVPTSAPTQSSSDYEQQGGQGELVEDYIIPEGATDEISQGVFYYELVTLDGETGDGLTPSEGAKKAEQLLISMDAFGAYGLYEGQCLYIAFDEIIALDSAMGREFYIYTVAVGTPEGGFMGDGYTPIYRVAVDYSDTEEAFVFDDYSGGQGDIVG